MKIKVEYIDTGTSIKTLAHCLYHMADGTIKHYYQLGKGQLKMNDYIDDKIGERGWVVADKEATTAYLKKFARQMGQNLAAATTETIADMRSIYSGMVDIHDMLQDLERGGEAWRIELCDMADSGLNIIELKAEGE